MTNTILWKYSRSPRFFWLIYELCFDWSVIILTIHFKNGLWMALVYFASKEEYPAFRF